MSLIAMMKRELMIEDNNKDILTRLGVVDTITSIVIIPLFPKAQLYVNILFQWFKYHWNCSYRKALVIWCYILLFVKKEKSFFSSQHIFGLYLRTHTLQAYWFAKFVKQNNHKIISLFNIPALAYISLSCSRPVRRMKDSVRKHDLICTTTGCANSSQNSHPFLITIKAIWFSH